MGVSLHGSTLAKRMMPPAELDGVGWLMARVWSPFSSVLSASFM